MTTPMEKDIEKALGRMVGRHGGMCLKWVCTGWAGVPDRIILLPGGQIIFVELKRDPSASGSSMQIWWARKLRDLGFIHFWVKSHEDVKALEKFILDRIRPPRLQGYTTRINLADEIEAEKQAFLAKMAELHEGDHLSEKEREMLSELRRLAEVAKHE